MNEKLDQQIHDDRLVDRVQRRPGNKNFSREVIKLPAIEVKNEVVWVNKSIELPFDIKRGESNRLGMFLTPKPDEENEHLYRLEAKIGHYRSGILGRVIFRDNEGRLYRDIDLKGIGYIGVHLVVDQESNEITKSKMNVAEPQIDEDPAYPDQIKTLGVLDRSFAKNDIKMAERFLKSEIRTYRPIALIKLEEIIDREGDAISLQEAKRRKLVKNSDEPVIEVRAFGTRARIQDLEGLDKKKSNEVLNDAMRLVAQEFPTLEITGLNNILNRLSRQRYFDWFLETMAVNVARMHAKNLIHGYLTSHNITLDARIIDLDSVETVREINEGKRAGEKINKSFDGDTLNTTLTLTTLKECLGLGTGADFYGPYGEALVLDIKVSAKFIRIYQEEYKKLKSG